MKISPAKERAILAAKLDYTNACRCVARAMRLGMEGMLNRATVDQRNAERALLALVLPYARVTSEFSYEMQSLHGEDGANFINELDRDITHHDVDKLQGYLYALEFDEPINALIK